MRRRLALLAPSALLAAVTVVVGLSPVLAGAAAPRATIDDLTVTGTTGEKPTVTFAVPFATKSSASSVLLEGTGSKAAKGDYLTIDYVVVNGRTGQEVQASYGSPPQTVQLSKVTAAPIVRALVGVSAGSRVAVAIAPRDGLAKGGESVGLKKTDTLVYVIDVRNVVERTAVAPSPGLPSVDVAKSGKPTIRVPEGEPPTRLVVQPLVDSSGPVVQAGQTLTVQYAGALWRNGKLFDSSWTRGTPAQFTVGTGKLIPGWDEGLVGQHVGSQVLLVVPPEKGYGAAGEPSAGIKGTDTLVFVVDILAAF